MILAIRAGAFGNNPSLSRAPVTAFPKMIEGTLLIEQGAYTVSTGIGVKALCRSVPIALQVNACDCILCRNKRLFSYRRKK